ncbi:exonuclease domain-containing protein [Albimonas sp. CAU 1670]|uniref:3'-5' exonuclease n=1 Tax=Albimonas sp. CAU 1670 TaxID=3032599 RepID=UPI0023DC0985|nr:exonuclease domain-containing protein [Albimonas sp. CAU 1670]MDF2234989.1 exonuclease domain-containing protein [Albimonas sp. CAU 1670]
MGPLPADPRPTSGADPATAAGAGAAPSAGAHVESPAPGVSRAPVEESSAPPPERLGLRLRFALFFAALALGGAACIAGALWFGHLHSGGPVEGYVTAGLAAGFALAGLCAWVALLFDENVARPILGLAADLHDRAQSDVSARIDVAPARHLGAIAPAAQAIHAALEEARESQERAVAERTARMARDAALFEGLVRDLAEAVVVASPDGRIMLYNQAAAVLLGPLGLGRPLARFLDPGPLAAAADRSDRRRARGEAGTESFLTAAGEGEGARLLSGAVSAVTAEGALVGRVLLFRDATEDLRAHGALETLMRDTLEAMRRPAAALGAALDALGAEPEPSPDERAAFAAAMREEVARLTAGIERAAASRAQVSDGRWPIRDIAAQDMIDALAAGAGGALTAGRSAARLRCDGYAMTRILARAVEALREDPGRRDFAVATEAGGEGTAGEGAEARVSLVLSWRGPALSQGVVEGWMGAPIAPAYGPWTVRDALERHGADLWVEGGTRLVLPLPAAGAPAPAAAAEASDFYEFDLPRPGGAEAARPLSELAFVVFDTETTGLDAQTDAVVQIAGVRMVGGRVLRGESFDALVDPGRPIPAGAARIHGIDDARVAGAPALPEVAEAFRAFCEGAVLVAHNAPFDMAFLRRLEAAGGPRFDNPVLCSARLSQRLHAHTGAHTLDDLAARFGVEIPAELRHTALGDAAATAEVFRRMLPLLAARRVRTLGEALALQGPV